MVLHLLVHGSTMVEHVATFLVPIRRRDTQFNIGAAVTERAQVVILGVRDDLPLSTYEATELQKKIREAVIDASMRTS